MNIVFDLNSIESYRKFLAVKKLPMYSFSGREASFPDEYASLVGEDKDVSESVADYEPIDGLFDYQSDIVKLAIKKQKFAVFANCGLGKSLIILEFARYVSSLYPNKAVMIVSPLMVLNQTISEANRFYGDRLNIKQIKASNLKDWIKEGTGIGITNYEAISDSLLEVKSNLCSIILDESSTLKSHYGKWGTRLIQLGKGLPYKMAATGTPAPNDQIEYGNHAVFLDQFPNVNAFLARFFVNRGETANRWELKPHAVHDFYRSLSHWSFFLHSPQTYGWKDNVQPLPPIRTHVIDVEMTEDQIEKAESLEKSKKTGIGNRAKLARIAKGVDAESRKPAMVKKLALEAKGSVIIWCKYNDEQTMLAEMIPEAASIEGTTDTEERERLIEKFKAGEIKILISKPKILGFGLNLQVATTMIFSTLQDSWEEYYQAVKRSNRYGSTEPLDVWVPLTEIEKPMYENVTRKADRINKDAAEQERIFKETNFLFY